jgi:zinc transport system substrate-binding protein
MLYYNITIKVLITVSLGWLLSVSDMVSADTGAKPLVVTSIKPLAIIAKSALQDRAQVEYLMSAAQSPHDTVILPSGIKKLAQADVVLWLGPHFEIRAAKHLQSLPQTKLITALELVGIDQGEMQDSEDHQHNHFDEDPHIWLSPKMAEMVAQYLQLKLNIPIKKIFTDAQRAPIERLLKPFKQLNYLSHHDGMSYFIEEFDLQPSLSIRDKLGKQRGAKTQYQLRIEAQQQSVHCVFVEPQHGHKDAMVVAQALQVPLMPIDLLASREEGALMSYGSYMLSLARQFSACFQ